MICKGGDSTQAGLWDELGLGRDSFFFMYSSAIRPAPAADRNSHAYAAKTLAGSSSDTIMMQIGKSISKNR